MKTLYSFLKNELNIPERNIPGPIRFYRWLKSFLHLKTGWELVKVLVQLTGRRKDFAFENIEITQIGH